MMRCIAIDDEPIALAILSRYCAQRGQISLETYSSPYAGMKRIKEWMPDIVLLDIELNDVSGLELAKQLPPECGLIFTTAYAHYALDGFDVNAIDFLHKPFFYERFDRAMQKAEQWLHMHDLLRLSRSETRQLTLKVAYKQVKVCVDSILYIEAIDNYIKLHLTDGSTLLSKIPLCHVEGSLPHGEFLRIHRSFIVNCKRIARFSHTEVILSCLDKHLPIGKKYAEVVTSALTIPKFHE